MVLGEPGIVGLSIGGGVVVVVTSPEEGTSSHLAVRVSGAMTGVLKSIRAVCILPADKCIPRLGGVGGFGTRSSYSTPSSAQLRSAIRIKAHRESAAYDLSRAYLIYDRTVECAAGDASSNIQNS